MGGFDEGMEEILHEFLIESTENVDKLADELIILEENPHDEERLASIFRSIHTIKGTCGFFAFEKLESISHAGENLLSKLRDGEFVLTADMTSALLRVVDAIKEILAEIHANNTEGNGDYSDLVQTLKVFLETPSEAAPDELPAEETPKEAEVPVPVVVEAPPEAQISVTKVAETVSPGTEDEPPKPLGAILVQEEGVGADTVSAGLKKQLEGDQRPLGEILSREEGVDEKKVTAALTKQDAQKTQAAAGSLSDSTIRVDVTLLDKLMNMVGELVLARNQILQFASAIDDANFVAASQRLNLTTSELQEGVMKTRMQPISAVWGKFPRVVRDLSASCDKKIRIEMEGKNTELDKSILEAIKDPLTHIVRNSVDHGLEMPEERVARGKSEEGLLLLRAYHEGGQVIIDIIDDGAGINLERVAEKAIERGIVTQQQVEAMSPRELTNMVLLPGFSTAKEVTNISGRGVGMDVVRTNIEKIGGTLDIQTERWVGTTLRIKIPLTLAIIPALVVTCAGDRYAIPQVNLVELVRLEGDEVRKKIESFHGSPVYRLRGNLLPLVRLGEVMKTDCGEDGDEEDCVLNIVVLQAEDRQFGLIVESVQDTEEIVVKPLSKQLKDLAIFVGATIMGDGRVALILDVVGLAHTANVISETSSAGPGESEMRVEEAEDEDRQTVLLFQCGAHARMAIPLTAVARLEEFAGDTVERVGATDVVQYRGEILPLIQVSNVFNEPLLDEISGDDRGSLHAIVYKENDRNVGLVVEKIVDITDATLAFRGQPSRPGVAYTGVIHGKVAEFVDVRYIIESAIPGFFSETPAGVS